MIVEYLRYAIDASRQVDFIDAYRQAAIPLLRSPYCNAYELCQCDEDPGCFIVRIEWTSAEDHRQKFRASDEFREFLPHVRPYIGAIDEMRHYTVCDSRSEA